MYQTPSEEGHNDQKYIYNGNTKLNFFIYKKRFRSACNFRYIFNRKLIIYPIAVVIEISAEITVHLGLL